MQNVEIDPTPPQGIQAHPKAPFRCEGSLKVSPHTATVHKETLANIRNSWNIWRGRAHLKYQEHSLKTFPNASEIVFRFWTCIKARTYLIDRGLPKLLQFLCSSWLKRERIH